MTDTEEQLRRAIAAAQAEAQKVGDSPLRADRVAEQVHAIVRRLPGSGLDEDRTARVAAALENALRVLRRDDDGREAARHLGTALGYFSAPPPRKSPFDD